MIEIDKLTDADKGREVRYQTFGRVEYGKITSWNEKYIFVRYHTIVEDSHSRPSTGSTSAPTSPSDLEFCFTKDSR